MDHQNTIPERNLVLIHIYITFSVCQKELLKAIREGRLYYSNVCLILSPAQCLYTPSYIIENIRFPLFKNEIFSLFLLILFKTARQLFLIFCKEKYNKVYKSRIGDLC